MFVSKLSRAIEALLTAARRQRADVFDWHKWHAEWAREAAGPSPKAPHHKSHTKPKKGWL